MCFFLFNGCTGVIPIMSGCFFFRFFCALLFFSGCFVVISYSYTLHHLAMGTLQKVGRIFTKTFVVFLCFRSFQFLGLSSFSLAILVGLFSVMVFLSVFRLCRIFMK